LGHGVLVRHPRRACWRVAIRSLRPRRRRLADSLGAKRRLVRGAAWWGSTTRQAAGDRPRSPVR
jgi:hypothetical protein